MVFNEEDNRLDIVQRYFISKKFGFKDDLDDLNNIAYSDGFLYTPRKIFLVQPDNVVDRSEVVIEDNLISTPTLISNSFIIRRKIENSMIKRKTTLKSLEADNRDVVFLLRPPVDSHKIAQVSYNDFELEFFLKDDEEQRIIRIVPDYNNFRINIKVFNFTDFEPFHVIDWDLLQDNKGFTRNQVIEESRYIKGEDFKPFEVIASKSGNQICVVIELQDKCFYQSIELIYEPNEENQ
jgi:hypothetical protein